MKAMIHDYLQRALEALQQLGRVPEVRSIDIFVERTKHVLHGDYSTNIAMSLAKVCGVSAPQLAALLVESLEMPLQMEKIEIAGPGFINFFIKPSEYTRIIALVLTEAYWRELKVSISNSSEQDWHDTMAPYAIQYAYTRTKHLFRQLLACGVSWDEPVGLNALHLLVAPQEIDLIRVMNHFVETVHITKEPCQLVDTLQILAKTLHSYYNAMQLLSEQNNLCCARLCLLKATQHILYNGMQRLGILAESM